MKISSLTSEDDLLLKCSIEAGASLEVLAVGNKKIPNKRKGGSICIPYYRKRRRINTELSNSPHLSFFDKCRKLQDHATLNHAVHVGDVMFIDRLANNLGSIATTDLIDKSADGCHESVRNDCINGSMKEDGLCKLTQNFCFLLTDNLMSFFGPDIELNDDTNMHDKGYSDDLSGVTEVEYESLPDSFFSFSDKDYIVCSLNTEDTVDDIPDSQLLDSPEHVLENPSFHCDQQDVWHCEDDMESTSISHLDPVHLSEGKIICILNTEDPEIPCNDNFFFLIHSSPYVRPKAATESADPASSFSQSRMDGPDLFCESNSASPHVGCTLTSVSMDHNPSISDHNNSDNDSDLPFFTDMEDPEIQSTSVGPQTAIDSFDSASSFTQSQMDGPDLSSEFDSANPHVGCTHKSVSMDYKPSISDHNSHCDLPCFPDIEDSEIPSPPVRPQTIADSIDTASCLIQSQMDDPGLSSEFISANPHVGCTRKCVSMDHNPSISDHESDSDLPCFPDIEDPVILSPPFRPQTATDSVYPASSFTRLQMDGPDLSPKLASAQPLVDEPLRYVSVDHNPSVSDHNINIDLPCVPDTKDSEIPSPIRSQTIADSLDPASCVTRSEMADPGLSSEFDSANPHAGCTLKSVLMDHNPSIPDDINDSDLPCFPDAEDPEVPSPFVRPQTAMEFIDPTSSFTQSQMGGPGLSSQFDSAHPFVDLPLKYVSVDHNPSISDHNNSDSDSDLPCFPDIEALILKLDFEYAQESWITNEGRRGKYRYCNRSISSLKKASSQRAMSSLGAFAVFYSHHCNYYIKKTEVTIGRSTDETDVDIDLKKESYANMISRQQATIKMETNGTFTLNNIGKGSIIVNGESVAHGQVAALGSNCLIQIRGMNFNFETNDRYVRWYLDNIMKKAQGKFTTFEWSVN